MGIGRLRDIKGDVQGMKIYKMKIYIKYLGIYVGDDTEECMKLNWDDNIRKGENYSFMEIKRFNYIW